MRAGSDYEFIHVDGESVESEIAAMYTSITGRYPHPASPERLFIQWVTAALVQAYANINYAGNQNIPSRAEGKNLDALAELYYEHERPTPKPATVLMQFAISESREAAVLIPSGTRVSSNNGSVTYATQADVYIMPGYTTADVRCVCEQAGTIGNGYAPGEISVCVDPFPYYANCVNLDKSDGGTDTATDEEFYDLIVASQSAYSCAGSRGAYVYFAKQVSTSISDVLVNSPVPGQVNIYALMEDGKPAQEEIKQAIYEACSADELRPLTDKVVVEDPDVITFNIDVTYYISNESGNSSSAIQSAVENAVDQYVKWQCGKIGRDINPSKLTQMIVEAGAKRVEITEPTFKKLLSEGDEIAPQLAQLGTRSVTNGGYEDE